MPRVSDRQYRHFERVEEAAIRASFSCGLTHRWLLELPYRHECGRTQTVCVILKNPSSATEQYADKTIQNVEREIYRLFPAAARVKIVNLFAIRATDTLDVRRVIDHHGVGWAIGHDNDFALQGAIEESDQVVAAWGAQSRILTAPYERRVKQVVRMLDGHRQKLWYVGGLSGGKRHPRHGMAWKSSHRAMGFLDGWRWWPVDNA